MPIYRCSHCPRTYVTQGELASHKHRCHSTGSVSASFQPNQGGMTGGSSYGAGIHPWSLQIEPVRVLNSALTPGDEVLIAANTIYWLSRDRKCILDYSHPQNLKFEASNGPASAKRRRGALKAASSATKKLVYRCDECGMEFSSYHALGGHKSGHRKVEARLRAAAAQLNQVQQQPQPQEVSPPAPPSPQHAKHLFDLNEPPPE